MKKLIAIVFCAFLAGSVAVNGAFAQEQTSASASATTGKEETSSNSATRRPRIGLALGGGGSRGSAHVGVLKVLKEENIPVDMIAGTSIGSVVGGFYAAGKPLDEIGQMFLKNTFTKEFTPMPALRIALEPAELMLRLVGYKPYDGLFYGWKFRGYVQKQLKNKMIEELPIPYAAVVTDVVTGKSCRLTSGDMGVAMQASTAVPGLKKPVQIGEKLYCDGGLINNVPVNHVREMGADFVIAVDIDEKLKDVPLTKFRGLGSMASQALRIQLATLDALRDEQADFYIHPDTTGIALVSFKKDSGKHGIAAGEAAARAAVPEIKRRLKEIGVSTVSSTGAM